MANDNKSIVEIPAAVLTQIADLVTQANTALQPYVTPLTNKERSSILKMGDDSIAFVSKTVDYTVSNPGFVPAYMNAADLKIDADNAEALRPVLAMIKELSDNVSDTEMVAGSEAFLSALMYYNTVKSGDKNGIAGARTIYEDLSQRFPGRPKKKGVK